MQLLSKLFYFEVKKIKYKDYLLDKAATVFLLKSIKGLKPNWPNQI